MASTNVLPSEVQEALETIRRYATSQGRYYSDSHYGGRIVYHNYDIAGTLENTVDTITASVQVVEFNSI